MKWFHNAAVGKFLVVGFAVAVHGMFALGMYYFGLFISKIILQDAPFLQQPAAIGMALLVFAGAMWGFVYIEYAREDVSAYSSMTGQWWFTRYLNIVQVAIAGAELSSLAYRTYQVQNSFDRVIVAAFGLIFLAIAYCLGKTIHAMANRPFAVAVSRARQEAGRSIVDDAMKYVPRMTVEQKVRFYNGDITAVDEVLMADYDAKQARTQRKTDKEEARTQRGRDDEVRRTQRDTQDEQESAAITSFTDRLLNRLPAQPKNTRTTSFLDAQTNQASRLGQNGRQ